MSELETARAQIALLNVKLEEMHNRYCKVKEQYELASEKLDRVSKALTPTAFQKITVLEKW